MNKAIKDGVYAMPENLFFTTPNMDFITATAPAISIHNMMPKNE